MSPRRALLLVAVLLGGCFTDQSSSGSDGASTGSATTGGGDTTSATQPDGTSQGESTAGSTGALSSSSSGLGTSPGTTAVEECGEMQACVPTGLPGWSDPMLIIASSERLPGCPAGDLLWRAGQGTDIAMCSCDCTLNGECTAEVLFGTGGTCDFSVEVIADQCQPVDEDLTGNLSARLSLPIVDDVACDVPPPPGADFETNILACELPGIGDCDAGVCVPLLPGPDTATCIAWEEEGEAPPCPEPFVVARTVFDEIDASALSCDTCECAPEDLACEDAVATMHADNACAGSGASATEGPCTELGIAASGVQSVGFQASLTGTCAGNPVAPSGEAALSGERSLCCRR